MRSKSAENWQNYWRGAYAAGNKVANGTDLSAVSQFWHNFFVLAGKKLVDPASPLRVLDVASGGGAILKYAVDGLTPEYVSPFCMDISASAVKGVCERAIGTQGIVADAATWPLIPECMDVIVSQFGVEYAGLAAVSDMGLSVRPGGHLAMLLHYHDGAIHRECTANLQGIVGLERCRFIELSLAMFRDAFEVLRGGPREPYEASSKALIPAFRKLEDLMANLGMSVANGLLLQVYKDVDHIHTNLPKFDRDEVLAWLQSLHRELAEFAGRMGSMCDAAADRGAFEQLLKQIRENGFEILEAGALVSDQHDWPLAWKLVAGR
ncbi:class I SAM-dependent methyltransferase [Microbulbifer bruguierae]|uniref:Class I SAM-dependent methyltransferase n=1 Tax=Microbulbifer bruguierae TaxID=3029061 RepID=A0ABY8ND31_9GAMM|nr:class I SAM-dependent methyltransferase [Microbulbifer bruguierae]WGL16355.1 class I SAM-dependent methyltransferase [Microbulbifer bruguierae]